MKSVKSIVDFKQQQDIKYLVNDSNVGVFWNVLDHAYFPVLRNPPINIIRSSIVSVVEVNHAIR